MTRGAGRWEGAKPVAGRRPRLAPRSLDFLLSMKASPDDRLGLELRGVIMSVPHRSEPFAQGHPLLP